MPNQIQIPRRAFLVMPLAFAACRPSAEVIRLSGTTMGTTYNVTIVDSQRSIAVSDAQAAIERQLAAVNREMSNWDETSEVSRFNAGLVGDAFEMSAGFAQVMTTAGEVHGASGGHFDVTVGGLVDLWGFGAAGTTGTPPSEAAIARARAASGQAEVLTQDGRSLSKTHAEARVYLSAIGKGHGVDRVAEALESLGATDYMVEIGGDLRTRGTNPEGLPWQVGVETPEAHDRRVHRLVGLNKGGLATSGDYRNYFNADGVRYSHIIDPSTGRPVTHDTASATVIAETAMHADAWATAMLSLGREAGLEVAEAQGLAVLFIDRRASDAGRFSTYASTAFEALQS